jgi:MFS family permease
VDIAVEEFERKAPRHHRFIRKRFPLLVPFLDRNYLIYWIGRTVSFSGDQFQTVALAIVALDLTNSTSGLGAILTVQAIPRAVLMLFGGAATDRFRARTVMLVSDSLQSLVVLGLAILAFSGALSLWHLIAYAALSGTVFAFFLPASNTIVTDLVPNDQVRAANALGNTAFNAAVFIVPPLAGVAVASLGVAPAFAFNSAALMGSVATLSLIREKPRAATSHDGEHPNVLRHLRTSLAAARRDTPTFLTLIMAIVYCLGFFGGQFVALPALAKLTLGAGDAGVGLILGARGIGGIVGGLIAGGVAIRRLGLVGSIVILGLAATTALGAVSPTLWLAIFWFALSGICGSAVGVIFFTLIQLRAPDEHRGGIMGLVSLAIFGITPLGFAIAGAVGSVFGPREILLFSATCIAASGVLGLSSKAMREA